MSANFWLWVALVFVTVTIDMIIMIIIITMLMKYEDWGSPGKHRGFHRLPGPPSGFLALPPSDSNPFCCPSCQVFQVIFFRGNPSCGNPSCRVFKAEPRQTCATSTQLLPTATRTAWSSNQPSSQVLYFRCKPQGFLFPGHPNSMGFSNCGFSDNPWYVAVLNACLPRVMPKLKEFCFQSSSVLLPDSPGAKSHCWKCNCSFRPSSQLRSHVRCFCRRLMHH